MNVREIAEKVIDGHGDELDAEDIIDLAAHVLRSPEPLGDEHLEAIDEMMLDHGDNTAPVGLAPDVMRAVMAEIRRLQAELKTTEGVYAEYRRIATEERDDLRAQLQTAEQKILRRDKEVGRVTSYWVEEENKAVELESSLQASQQEVGRAASSLRQAQLERDNYASQLTLVTKFLGEKRQEAERLRERLRAVVAMAVFSREAAVLIEQVSPSAAITTKESDRLDLAGRKLRILSGMLAALALSPAPSAPQGEQGDTPAHTHVGGWYEQCPACAATPAPSRDWTEDTRHENGNYQNRCVTCHQMFIGHKRRVTCKACATPAVEHQDTAIAAKEPEPGQNTCTVHHPYDASKDDGSQRWSHPSARCVYDGDDYDRYECPICGLRFKVEIAQ